MVKPASESPFRAATGRQRNWRLAGLAMGVAVLGGGIYLVWQLFQPSSARRALELRVEGIRLWEQFRLVPAEQKLRASLRLDPGNFDAVSTLSDLLFTQGREEDAREVLWNAYPDFPQYPSPTNRVWLLNLIWASYDDRRSTILLHRCHDRLSQAEPTLENRLGLAINYVLQGRPEDLQTAEPILWECFRQRPDSLLARRWLFRCLMEQQKVAQAAEPLQRLPERLRQEPEVLRMQARFALAQNRPEEAVEPYQRLLQSQPADLEGHSQLAAILTRLGQAEQARYHLDRHQWATELSREATTRLLELQKYDGIAAAADTAFLCYRMGEVTRQMGRFREAKAWYEEALRRRPDYPEAQQALQELDKIDQESY